MPSNIYTELKIAGATLRAVGRIEDARALTRKVYACTTVEMARAIIHEYMKSQWAPHRFNHTPIDPTESELALQDICTGLDSAADECYRARG